MAERRSLSGREGRGPTGKNGDAGATSTEALDLFEAIDELRRDMSRRLEELQETYAKLADLGVVAGSADELTKYVRFQTISP